MMARHKSCAHCEGKRNLGRTLQGVLNYARWENFEAVIEKAKTACANSEVDPNGQFRRTTKLITHGNGAKRGIGDWYLSRYACYLIAMNGDPQVSEVAYAQQYFAVETRLREQEAQQLSDYDRVAHRRRVTATVKALSSAAKKSGVQRYGLFYDAGYRGLYGGLGLSAIKARKRMGIIDLSPSASNYVAFVDVFSQARSWAWADRRARDPQRRLIPWVFSWS